MITTTTGFVNGVFTVTTVEQYRGYTTILSSTFQTSSSTTGLVTTSGSTTTTHVAPTGLAYSVQTTTSITTTSSTTQSTTTTSTTTPAQSSNGSPGREKFYRDFFAGFIFVFVGVSSVRESFAIATVTSILIPEASPFVVPAALGLALSGGIEIGIGITYLNQAYQDAVQCGGWTCVNPFG